MEECQDGMHEEAVHHGKADRFRGRKMPAGG